MSANHSSPSPTSTPTPTRTRNGHFRTVATVAAGAAVLAGAVLLAPGGPDLSLAADSPATSSVGGVQDALPLAPNRTLDGFPVVDTTKVMNRVSGTDDLPSWHSEENWYYCGGYDRITTPNGVDSAWPYYRGDDGNWHNRSSKGISATGNDITNANGVKILFTNWAFSTGQSRIDFDCISMSPKDDAVHGIDISVGRVTATDAEIKTAFHSFNGHAQSWHIEYGTKAGDYSQRTPDAQPGPGGTWADVTTTQSQIVTGLTPGTRYHYRIAAVYTNGNVSFSPPNNFFTTAEEPKEGTVYGLAPGTNAELYVDDQNFASDNGSRVQLARANGSAAQQWRLEQPDGEGYYHLVNAVNGKCAGIYGGDIEGNPIDLWDCDINTPNQSNQLWKPVLTDDGSAYQLVSKAGLSLTLTEKAPSAGQQLTVQRYHASTWQFIPLS